MARKRSKDVLLRYRKDLQRNLLARPGANRFVVVLDHLKPGFNVGKIFRTAEVFGACEIHLVGIGPFDPGPAKGALRKVPLRQFEKLEESMADLRHRGYRLYLLDAAAKSLLGSEPFPELTAFIFGHEEFGSSLEMARFPHVTPVAIRQFGQTESLNVSSAAAIAMYEYLRQHPGDS
ncbi:MAG: TrmH family RNA methyltransferase [Desulfuromonas sp.]|nr:MAG: TrmH family RNA methyltransferase [Desulfuromonas sp.]